MTEEMVPEPLRGKRELGPGSSFTFECRPGLDCYTHCCADVNVVLTPLDVLHLARKTGLTTGQFLERHTLTPITRELRLPVVMLKMGPAPEKRCPFVGPQGCSVYSERPWACRMYPVGAALPPARAGLAAAPCYYLLEDEWCRGRGEPRRWTVEAWQRNQDVASRDDLEAGFHELVGHPWFIGGRQLDPRQIQMFHLACYDLDGFREFVFESSFLRRFELDSAIVEELRHEDYQLLRFAFRWLRYALFGEPTMQLRPEEADQPQTD